MQLYQLALGFCAQQQKRPSLEASINALARIVRAKRRRGYHDSLAPASVKPSCARPSTPSARCAVPSPPNARAIFTDLCASLPKAATETEETITARAKKAIKAVFALRPEDDFEALLATRIVAMNAHAMDALHSASLAAGEPDEVRRCCAQAASMACQSDAALRTLRRMQHERDKAFNEMHPATMGRAGCWFREVSVPAPDHDPGPTAADAEPERTQADIAADVKLYAAMYPDRVRHIYAAGGLPPDLDFGSSGPEIVTALLRSYAGHAERAGSHGTRQ